MVGVAGDCAPHKMPKAGRDWAGSLLSPQERRNTVLRMATTLALAGQRMPEHFPCIYGPSTKRSGCFSPKAPGAVISRGNL